MTAAVHIRINKKINYQTIYLIIILLGIYEIFISRTVFESNQFCSLFIFET